MSDDVRLPPNSIDSEQAVIGALLVRPELYQQVAQIVDATDFYRKHHSNIWKAIADLSDRGALVDILTVSQQLNDADQRSYIIGLSVECYNPSGAVYHAKQLRAMSRARKLQKRLASLHERAYSEPVDDVLSSAELVIRDLIEPDKDESITAGDIIADVIEDLTFRCEHPGVLFGIPSGYRALDEITGGFDPGSLIALGGRTHMGKTTITVDMVKTILTHYKLDVAFFSLEMAKQEIMKKLLLNVGGISGVAARWGRLDARDWDLLGTAQATLSDGGRLHLFDRGCFAVSQIRRHLMALPQLPPIIFIDHLHIMHGERGTTDRMRELGEITMDLKNLAKELGIAIVALCQLNRGLLSRGNDNKVPNMADLRASGEIEENCDQIVFIHRPGVYDENADQSRVELHVAKMRQEADSNRLAVLRAQPSIGRFYNVDAMGPLEFILKPSNIRHAPKAVSLTDQADIPFVCGTPIEVQV